MLVYGSNGLPINEIFIVFYGLLNKLEIYYYFQWTVECINKPDQLFLTLMKLRHNFPYFDWPLHLNAVVVQ